MKHDRDRVHHPTRVRAAEQSMAARRAAGSPEFQITEHAIDRFVERCPMAKTLERDDLRRRLTDLVEKSSRWGRNFFMAEEWSDGHEAFRLLSWGPYRLVGALTPRGAGKFALKTVLTDECARRSLVKNHGEHKVEFK